LQSLPDFFADFHHPRRAAADHQYRRLGGNRRLQIFHCQQVPLFSPPVGLHGIAKDEAVTAVCRPINNNISKFVRINVHTSVSLGAGVSRFNVVYRLVLKVYTGPD